MEKCEKYGIDLIFQDLKYFGGMMFRHDDRPVDDDVIRQTVENACLQIAKESTEEAYKRQFAVTFRVLKDRFGFGRERLRRMWDLCLEYINDIDEGRLSTKEMLDTLQREDGIGIDWHIKI